MYSCSEAALKGDVRYVKVAFCVSFITTNVESSTQRFQAIMNDVRDRTFFAPLRGVLGYLIFRFPTEPLVRSKRWPNKRTEVGRENRSKALGQFVVFLGGFRN